MSRKPRAAHVGGIGSRLFRIKVGGISVESAAEKVESAMPPADREYVPKGMPPLWRFEWIDSISD